MLESEGVPFHYREYRNEPLSVEEIQEVLSLLGASPREVLRRNDRAFKAVGLTGDEDDLRLIEAMAANPTLLQRPIGVYNGRAAVGRPPERLLDLLEST